jgi:hypothetical protein
LMIGRSSNVNFPFENMLFAVGKNTSKAPEKTTILPRLLTNFSTLPRKHTFYLGLATNFYWQFHV